VAECSNQQSTRTSSPAATAQQNTHDTSSPNWKKPVRSCLIWNSRHLSREGMKETRRFLEDSQRLAAWRKRWREVEERLHRRRRRNFTSGIGMRRLSLSLGRGMDDWGSGNPIWSFFLPPTTKFFDCCLQPWTRSEALFFALSRFRARNQRSAPNLSA
jgi:hypothetical protein